MNKFYNETLHRLKTTVNELEVEADCSIQRIEAVILLIVECLSELKEYVLKTGFSDEDEEIRFFKHQKPTIVAKLIYYNAVYKIEAKRPYGGKEVLEEYFNKELSKLKKVFLITIWRFTAITEPTALILTTPILFVASTMFN